MKNGSNKREVRTSPGSNNRQSVVFVEIIYTIQVTKYISLHKYISASVFIFHQGVSLVETHLEPSRISTMELLLWSFYKHFIVDVRLGSKNAST